MSVSRHTNADGSEWFNVQITLLRKNYYFGYFDSLEEANEVSKGGYEAKAKGANALLAYKEKYANSVRVFKRTAKPRETAKAMPTLYDAEQQVLSIVKKHQYATERQIIQMVKNSYLRVDCHVPTVLTTLLDKGLVKKQGNNYYVV